MVVIILRLWDLMNNGKRIKYKGKRFRLTKDYRKHICQNCGKQDNNTHLHHKKYSQSLVNLSLMRLSKTRDKLLLRNTIELCKKCHIKAHSKKG